MHELIHFTAFELIMLTIPNSRNDHHYLLAIRDVPASNFIDDVFSDTPVASSSSNCNALIMNSAKELPVVHKHRNSAVCISFWNQCERFDNVAVRRQHGHATMAIVIYITAAQTAVLVNSRRARKDDSTLTQLCNLMLQSPKWALPPSISQSKRGKLHRMLNQWLGTFHLAAKGTRKTTSSCSVLWLIAVALGIR